MCVRTPARRDWQALAIVAAAAIVPYLNALLAGFAFDDGPVIRDNPVVTGPLDLLGIIAAPYYPGNLYRPLTLLTYVLNERIAPGNAPLFHALNLALHMGVTLLVYTLGVTLCRNRAVALVAAVLFAVHPIHTEAVTGIVGRAELLAALFGLLALRAAIAGVDPAQRPSGADAVALLAFTAAVFSKESAVTILPLIPLCRALRRGGSLWPALGGELRSGHWIPFALAAGLFLISRTYIIGSLTLPTRPIPLDNVLAYTPPDVRIRTALAILSDYAGLLLLPLVLSADYSYPQVLPVGSWGSLRVICGLALLAAGLVAFLAYGKRRPLLSVLAVFPLVTLSLTCNLVFPIGTVKAERLLYLPSVGCALLAARLAWHKSAAGSRRPAGALVALVTVAFAARTWIRNTDWTDNLRLFQTTVDAAPRSAKAHHDLGIFLTRVHRNDEAAIHFREALELFKDYDESAFSIAVIYEDKGLANGAIAWYQRSLAINPEHKKASIRLCSLLIREQDFAAAEAACRHGLRFAPANADLLKGLGGSLFGLGERARALAVFHRSLAINPADAELRAALAQLETADGTSG